MAANFLQVKICSNGMIGIHRKNSTIMLRPTEVQCLIQDLLYARKAVAKTSDPRIVDEMNFDAENIYLKGLIGIMVKLLCKEMYVEVYKRCEGCTNDEAGQQAHEYCLLVDPKTKAVECFEAVFSKVDIYLANELCFEKVKDIIPIPVRDVDLYMNREKLLENVGWMNELRSNFVEAYSLSM